MTNTNTSLLKPMRNDIEEQERLEAALLRGLESPLRKWTPDDMDYVRNAVRERLAQKKEAQ